MHAMSVYIAREQFIRHQIVERMQAHSEDFHTRVVHALLHTRVLMKFKSSCTVRMYINHSLENCMDSTHNHLATKARSWVGD